MHDLKAIRDAADAFDRGLGRRGLPPESESILGLDTARRSAQTALQELQTRRNEVSRQIGQARAKGDPAEALMAEVAAIKNEMIALEAEEKRLAVELDSLLAALPN